MIVSAAMDLAEEQIRSGTASAQVITHFLKLGSSREMLEQERIAKENTLLQAKADALAAQARIEELYGEAINAMRAYSGQAQTEVGDEYDD
jgi:hypothetical protein